MTEFEIEPELVQSAISQGVKMEDFKIVAGLINMAEARKIDISGMNPHIFGPMLERCLNEKFDVQNLALFLKFYVNHFESRFKLYKLDPSKADITDPSTYQKVDLIFKNQDVADIGSIFSLLVNKLGKEELVDTFSHKNILDRLIAYSSKYVQPFQYHLKGLNTLREADVAQYHANHFERPSIVEKILKVAMHGGESHIVYSSYMIEHIKKMYQSGNIPDSFSNGVIKTQYKKF